MSAPSAQEWRRATHRKLRVILSRHFAVGWARPPQLPKAKQVPESVRVILTLIAIALVAVLTAALVVPYFVDWSSHRDAIAARLEGLTGGHVTLAGPVTLRLLPTPYLEVGAGSAAGEGPNAPRLAFEGARLELALAKLASGAFRFTDVRLDEPGPDARPQSRRSRRPSRADADRGRRRRDRPLFGPARRDPDRSRRRSAGMVDRRD